MSSGDTVRSLSFIAMGMLVAFPIVLTFARYRRLSSAWGWLTASALLGLVLKPVYAATRLSPGDAEALFWRDVDLTSAWLAAGLATVGTTLLTVGYRSALGTSRPDYAPSESVTSGSALVRGACTTFAALGPAALYRYVSITGGFDPTSLSTKRVVLGDLSATELQGVGPELAVGRAALIASIALFHLQRSRQRSTILAVGLIGVNLLLPIYSSDRTGVLLPLLQIGLLVTASRSKRIRPKTVVVAVLVAMMALQLLTSLRAVGRTEADVEFSPLSTVDSLLLNRSLFDLSKNIHVMRLAGGDELGWMFGESYVNAVLAPVPRSIWPAKPLISTGPELAKAAYDSPGFGVPPGLIGEAYWNFSLIGLLLIPTFVGRAVGKLDAQDLRGLSPFSQIVYVVLLLPIPYNAVAGSAASTAVEIYRDALLLATLAVVGRLDHAMGGGVATRTRLQHGPPQLARTVG